MQLETEMGEGRGEWLALSVDAETIWEEMQGHVAESATGLIDDRSKKPSARQMLKNGSAMWRNFLALIGWSESRAVVALPAGQLDFYDCMLEIWAEDNLATDGRSYGDVEAASRDTRNLIGPGTLVRAKSHISNDVLLYEQEIIRSLVLVLADTPDETVGIILNHPLAAAIECLEGESLIPCRYGGPVDSQAWKAGSFHDDDFDGADEEILDDQSPPSFVYDEGDSGFGEDNDNDDSPFIWIHRDAALGSRGSHAGGGSPLGTSGVWLIKEADAIKALQSGVLGQEDTMVFSSVCIWEKSPHLGIYQGGLREQIDALQVFEVVQAGNGLDDNDVLESVWGILSRRQRVLSTDSFESNIDAAVDAWAACTSNPDSPDDIIQNNDSSRLELSDAALRAWLGVNLLGNPLGTLVEVTKSQ